MDENIMEFINIKSEQTSSERNKVVNINSIVDKIMKEVNAIHNPVTDGILECDICGATYDLDKIQDGPFGHSIVSLDHGVFWACDDCVQNLVVEKLENIKNWN